MTAVDANGLPVVRPEWLGVYDAIASQHGALESAVKDMTQAV